MREQDARRWLNLAVGIIGYVGLVLVSVWLIWGPGKASLDQGGRIMLTVLAYVIGIVWALFFAVRAFQAGDEFVQQRSRVAWYWGGLFGLAASAPVFIFIRLGGLTLIQNTPYLHLTPAEGQTRVIIFTTGYMLAIVPQFIGFAIASAWWKWSKR